MNTKNVLKTSASIGVAVVLIATSYFTLIGAKSADQIQKEYEIKSKLIEENSKEIKVIECALAKAKFTEGFYKITETEASFTKFLQNDQEVAEARRLHSKGKSCEGLTSGRQPE